ncbi:hypothetical protein [Peribacillus sp. SCS-37]|uniref:hypothetical protein n=1 Tax=Paraperibacillus esterisolvens TaxID=3115296 RepID=UPI003905C57B
MERSFDEEGVAAFVSRNETGRPQREAAQDFKAVPGFYGRSGIIASAAFRFLRKNNDYSCKRFYNRITVTE